METYVKRELLHRERGNSSFFTAEDFIEMIDYFWNSRYTINGSFANRKESIG